MNCLLRRHYVWNIKPYFLGKLGIKNIISLSSAAFVQNTKVCSFKRFYWSIPYLAALFGQAALSNPRSDMVVLGSDHDSAVLDFKTTTQQVGKTSNK